MRECLFSSLITNQFHFSIGLIPALRRFSQRIGLTRRKKTERKTTIEMKEELMKEDIARPIRLQVFSSEPSRIPDRPPPPSPSTPCSPIVTHV